MINNYIVYKHTSPNNKVYIGITCQNPVRRWRKDGSGYKSHKYFWNAIQKYGLDNFKHEILYSGLSKEEAEQKEIKMISFFDSTNSKNGYNMSFGGESGSVGYKFTDEQKAKLRQTHIGERNGMFGKIHTKETNEKNRIAHLKDNLSQETIEKMSNAKKGKKRTKQSIEKQKETISKKVVCLETKIEYSSAKQAEKINNIDPSCITKVCQGKRKTAGQLHWCYKRG